MKTIFKLLILILIGIFTSYENSIDKVDQQLLDIQGTWVIQEVQWSSDNGTNYSDEMLDDTFYNKAKIDICQFKDNLIFKQNKLIISKFTTIQQSNECSLEIKTHTFNVYNTSISINNYKGRFDYIIEKNNLYLFYYYNSTVTRLIYKKQYIK